MNSGSDKPCSFYALISSPVNHRGHLRIIAEYQMLSICYHMLTITSASPVFMRVSAKTVLFQLYCSRRFTRNIVEHAVDSLHLVNNAVHGGLEDIPWNLGRLCRHEVAGDDSAQDNGQAVGESQRVAPARSQRRRTPFGPVINSRYSGASS